MNEITVQCNKCEYCEICKYFNKTKEVLNSAQKIIDDLPEWLTITMRCKYYRPMKSYIPRSKYRCLNR